MKERETELKLALSPEQAQTLVDEKALRRFRAGPAQTRRLTSTYYDTPRQLLRKRGIALRVRDDGTSLCQTLKVPTSGPAGMQNFMEWTLPLDSPVPILAAFDAPVLGKPAAIRRLSLSLQPLFTTDFERTTALLKTRRAKIELAVDQGLIRAGSKEAPAVETICEVELELISGNPSELLRIAIAICETRNARPSFLTKAQRGYALVSPTVGRGSRKASPTALSTEMTIHGAFREITTGTLEQLIANIEPASHGDPDGVHQLRVGMRRLRAALGAFKTVLPYHKRKAFNSELRWFQQRFAPARDWHVFLTETWPRLAESGVLSGSALHTLRRVAREERRTTTAAAIDHLQSRRFSRFLLEFEKWIADLDADHKSILDRPLVPFARRVLRDTRSDLTADTRPLGRLSTAELHELRKIGKKARYATEFFSSLWPGEHVEPYLHQMERLQQAFGDINDAAAASRIVWSLRPGRIDPTLASIVQNWSDSRAREAMRAARPVWRRFRVARTFWTKDRAVRPARAP